MNSYAGKNGSNSSSWVELVPSGNKNMHNQPYVAALLTHGGYRSRKAFEIFLGAGGCSWRVDNNEIVSFLYDIDGNGLVEAHANNPFSIPRPLGDKISIAIDLKNGERIGPFTYDFDIKEVIQGAVHKVKSPRLECTYHGGDWHCRAPGTYGVILSWVNVKKIVYGNDSKKLNNEVMLDLKEEDILNYAVGRGKSERAFKFDIPEDWENVFYKIEFIDGSTSEVLRVPIKKY